MKKLIYSSTQDLYDSIRRDYPLVATFTDDLYGQVLSLYDQGNGRFALLDDQNKEVAEVREYPNADSNWIHRYVRHIQQYLCKIIPTVEYSPEYDIKAGSETIINDQRNSKINSSTELQGVYPSSYFSQYREAKDFLDAQDPDKVALVEDCRKDIFEAYNNYANQIFDNADNDESIEYEEAPFSRIESNVVREYRSIAAEQWGDLSVSEANEVFNKIFDALCIIHADDAAAWW